MPLGNTEHVAVVETEVFKAPNTTRFYDYIVEKRGPRERPRLSDIDMMELYDIAPSMQGTSLTAGLALESGNESSPLSAADEAAIRERLSGLGYI